MEEDKKDEPQEDTAIEVAKPKALKKRKKKEKSKRGTKMEIEDRRREVAQMRARGYSLREIGRKLGVSAPTVLRDIEKGQAEGIRTIEALTKEEYMAETVFQYDDIIRKTWDLFETEFDTDVKLKALNQVRMVLNDKRKALQDTGFVEKTKEVNEENVNVNIRWTKEALEATADALLEASLTGVDEKMLPRPDENILDVEPGDVVESGDE